jgi:hypothetical protein
MEFADAKSLYQQALDIRRNALGSDHPRVVASFDNLANLERAQAAMPTPKQPSRRHCGRGRRPSDPIIPTWPQRSAASLLCSTLREKAKKPRLFAKEHWPSENDLSGRNILRWLRAWRT